MLLTLLSGLLLWPAIASAQEEVVYYHTDAIGSVRAITDHNGDTIARYDYLPFGELWPTVPAPPNERRQFAGKERDFETTGLDYFGARYHRPVSGRFTTVDPVMNVDAALTDPQRWNRYAYATNRPFTTIDPDGREPVSATTLAIAGGIGAVVYGGWNAYANLQQGRPWYENLGVEASRGFLVGATLGAAGPALAAGSAANVGVTGSGAAALAVGATGRTAIGFAQGTGGSAFAPDRLQHASRHLTEAGLLGNWSKATGKQFVDIGTRILENPAATFDHVLRGGEAVKGFVGTVGNQTVAFLVYKTGTRAGQIATAIVPSANQLERWGLR